jgi:hypothetical protein
MIAHNLPPVDLIPDIVRGYIFAADNLQQTRRTIAAGLGTWYVVDERREPGRQAARDHAAANARAWRIVANGAGHNPSAVRRAVLQNLAR